MLFFLIFMALIFVAYFIAKYWGDKIFNYVEKSLEDFLREETQNEENKEDE